MQTPLRRLLLESWILPGIIALAFEAPLLGQEKQEVQRDQIGEVLGRPVYRDEIRTGKHLQTQDELHRLFSVPVLEKYLKAHKAEVEPTEEEIATATACFDKKHLEMIKGKEKELRAQLKAVEQKLSRGGFTKDEQQKLEREQTELEFRLEAPGRPFALFILNNWKLQRHFYDQFGGGRILWQQAGLEAFDAMHEWLKAQEKNGEFKITDPELRSAFYDYWTTMNHGAFLMSSKELIREEFLEPDWLKKPAAADTIGQDDQVRPFGQRENP